MLCGGVRRAPVTVYRVGVAALGWFVSFSLARYYHMGWDLSTPFSDFSEILFCPSLAPCSTCPVPRVYTAPRSPCRLFRCPVSRRLFRAAPRPVVCRLLTYRGIGGEFTPCALRGRAHQVLSSHHNLSSYFHLPFNSTNTTEPSA